MGQIIYCIFTQRTKDTHTHTYNLMLVSGVFTCASKCLSLFHFVCLFVCVLGGRCQFDSGWSTTESFWYIWGIINTSLLRLLTYSSLIVTFLWLHFYFWHTKISLRCMSPYLILITIDGSFGFILINNLCRI